MTFRTRSALGFRLLSLTLGLALAILAVHPGHASFTTAGCASNTVTTYYSDASHSTVVGRCAASCCDGCTCTGTQTIYSTSQHFECLDVLCPQSS